MPYKEFLSARRERIARFIADAVETLGERGDTAKAPSISIEDLIEAGEGIHVEFKSTLRVNLHTGEKDPRMELACLKTIAGFLNSHGGTLIVGVSDDGETVGISVDGFANEDKMNLHLGNLLRDRIGTKHAMYIHPRFEDRDDARVLVVECAAANSPVFVKDGSSEHFYVRSGAATAELTPSETQQYLTQRF
jgi:predicted HTH transcriptional regulator